MSSHYIILKPMPTTTLGYAEPGLLIGCARVYIRGRGGLPTFPGNFRPVLEPYRRESQNCTSKPASLSSQNEVQILIS